MADAESSSITNSSLAPSTTPTSILDSLPALSSDRTASTDKVDRRTSFGLIDAARVRFSKDFSSLLRSNSSSQPIRTALSPQTADPENEHFCPNHVKLASHTVDLHLHTMDDSQDERPGRGFGARIVNFLNRSRSRSRSKKRRSRSLDVCPADPMPTTTTAHMHSASLRLHARHSSLETDQDALVAGPSRPMTRSPSRPLSGTLAPTNVSSKSRSRKAPEQISVRNATAELVAQVVPVEHTKSGSSSKKGKTFNIFGILLSSPKKASFGDSARGRSRPSTPSSAAPAPPDQQLWHGSDVPAWEVKSGSNRSRKSTRKGVAVDVVEAGEAHPLPRKSIDGKGAAVPGLVVPQPRRAPIHVLSSPPPLPRSGYSGLARAGREYEEDDADAQASVMEGRCSPLCGFGGSSSKGSHASQEKGKEKERMRGARERSWERERAYERKEKESEKEKEKEKARERRRDKEKEREHITHPRRVGSPLPMDHRPRESTPAVAVASARTPLLPLEKTASNRSAGSKNSAGKEHHGHGHPPRSGADGVAARAKRTKHGSFDFERPVSAGVGASGTNAGLSVKTALRTMGVGGEGAAPHSLQRSLSARGTASRRGTDESVDRTFAPSSVPNTRPILGKGKGKQDLDVHFADPPSRRATDNSQSSSSHQPQRHHHHTQSSSSQHRSVGLIVPSSHARDGAPASPISSNSGNSSSQNQHTRDGSWGRSGGKRVARASHGPFKFEPAVPPIPGSPADNVRRGASNTSTYRRPESPLFDTGASRSKQARMAGKGRSLDLGLGLSWAPSTVRAEAVLRVGPPRRPGTSASTGAARSKSRWRGADEEGRLTAGAASDVAASFREALGDSAYGIFKNYVHRFDANAIPLDGPYGLLAHIERLLDDAPGVDQRRKRVLLEGLLRVVQESENR